jgi:hypothetical protein
MVNYLDRSVDVPIDPVWWRVEHPDTYLPACRAAFEAREGNT